MIDTSVMVAGLVTNHEHHQLARPHVAAARGVAIPGIVVAESFARLRGRPVGFDVATTVRLLEPWATPERVLATPSTAYVRALAMAGDLNLGGNVHDLLIALTTAGHHDRLVTLDRRQARVAVPIIGHVEWLLA